MEIEDINKMKDIKEANDFLKAFMHKNQIIKKIMKNQKANLQAK